MNCGHSSDLVVYWGNEPRCLMCEHQELKEKLAAAKAERGHDGNGDDDRHSGLRERLHDTQLALYQANEDKGLLGQRLRSAEKQAADNGGKVLQLHNENERTKKALAAANADIDRLNQMLRKTGYGQGQIDSYAAECEARERAEERLAAAEAELDVERRDRTAAEFEMLADRELLRELYEHEINEYGRWTAGMCQRVCVAAKGGRDEI